MRLLSESCAWIVWDLDSDNDILQDNGLHPEIRAVQHANAVTKKYRKRGIPGPDIDRELAIRNVLNSLQRRGLTKRQTYDILKSNEPTTPDSMAVHQDGEDIGTS